MIEICFNFARRYVHFLLHFHNLPKIFRTQQPDVRAAFLKIAQDFKIK